MDRDQREVNTWRVFQAGEASLQRQEPGVLKATQRLLWPGEEQRQIVGLHHPGLPGRQCEDCSSEKDEPVEESKPPVIYKLA